MQLTVNTKVYNNMIYSEQQTATFDRQHFAYLKIQEENHILSIQLNRPLQKNALNEILQRELAFALSYAHFNKDIRVINLSAAGDIFCAGADLKTLMGHRDTDSGSTIPKEPQKNCFGCIVGRLTQALHCQSRASRIRWWFFIIGRMHSCTG
jgi:hypothetical protein